MLIATRDWIQHELHFNLSWVTRPAEQIVTHVESHKSTLHSYIAMQNENSLSLEYKSKTCSVYLKIPCYSVNICCFWFAFDFN